jgi:hypothetical protein
MLLPKNLQKNNTLSKASYSLGNIASLLDGKLVGDPNQLVDTLQPLHQATGGNQVNIPEPVGSDECRK